MTNNNKPPAILAPLLFSILLLSSANLKPTQFISHTVTNFFLPLQLPFSQLNLNIKSQYQFLTNLPQTYYHSLELKQENAQLKTQLLLSLNKLNLQDLPSLPWETTPVKITSQNQLITATSQQLEKIQTNQPLVSSTQLLGVVKQVKPPLIYLLPLTHPDIKISVRTETGLHATYIYKDHIPQIINLPNQSNLNTSQTIYTLPTENIPEGLILGQIKQVLTKPSEPLQRAEINLDTSLLYTNTPLNIITNPSVINP